MKNWVEARGRAGCILLTLGMGKEPESTLSLHSSPAYWSLRVGPPLYYILTPRAHKLGYTNINV